MPQQHQIEIRLPNIISEDEVKVISKMESFFSSIHGLLFKTTLNISIFKHNKDIRIIFSCTNLESLNIIKSYLISVDGVGIYEYGENLQSKISENEKRWVCLKKDYFTINTEERGFLKNLINYLATETNSGDGAIVFKLHSIPPIKKLNTYAKELINEEEGKDIERKRSSNMFLVQIYTVGSDKFNSSIISILNSVSKFNSFSSKKSKTDIDTILASEVKPLVFTPRFLRKYYGSYLNSKELASLLHPSVIERGDFKAEEAIVLEASSDFLHENENNVLIGQSTMKDGGSTNVYFPIENLDRHVYLVGKTGMGKSTLMVELLKALYEKEKDKAIIMFDPHGADLIEVARGVKNWDDLIYFNLTESNKTITFNPLFSFKTSIKEKDTRLEEIMEILEDESLKKNKDLGTSIEKLLNFLIASAIHFPDAYYSYLINKKKLSASEAEKIVRERQITLSDISEILKKRSRFIPMFKEVFKDYHEDIAYRWNYNLEDYLVNQAILDGLDNRMRFVIKDSIMPLFEGNKFDIVELVKQKKRILIPLTIQSFGKTSRKIILKFLIAQLWFYAQSITKEEDRQEVILFIDEFQNAQLDIIDSILSEARKYKIRLILANQYFGQLNDKIRSSVMGNVSSMFAFNIGNLEEAKYIPPLFRNKIKAEDIANLPPFRAYMKTLNPESNKETAFLSYNTNANANANVCIHNHSDISSLSSKCLEKYGEDVDLLKEKHFKKHKNPEEYFLEV